MTKVGLYAIGKSTTLESNKSLLEKLSLTWQKKCVRNPPQFWSTPVSLAPAPAVGWHTRDVLAEVGTDQCEELVAKAVASGGRKNVVGLDARQRHVCQQAARWPRPPACLLTAAGDGEEEETPA